MRVDTSAILGLCFIGVSIFLCYRGKANAVAYEDVTLFGKVSYVDEIKVIILNCQTTKQLLHQYAEFFVDQQTTDFVKFVRGKCYSRKGKCNDKRCVCSKNGQDFKWIFYPKDYLRSQYVFSCQVRSLDKNNNVITTTVVLLYDGSVFSTELQKDEIVAKDTDAVLNFNAKDNESNIIRIAAGVTGGVVGLLTVLLVPVIVCFFKRRRDQEFELGYTNTQNHNNIEMSDILEAGKEECSHTSPEYVTMKRPESTYVNTEEEVKFENKHVQSSNEEVLICKDEALDPTTDGEQ